MKKNKIFHLIQDQLENNIEELNQSLASYRGSADLDEGDTLDLDDFSQQSESKDIQRQLEHQLAAARDQLVRLQEIAGDKDHTAGVGALIETANNLFLLGLSLSQIQVGEKELLGISVESPAYALIDGKSKGETFKLGSNTYSILGIY